jgi:hypothetical protein
VILSFHHKGYQEHWQSLFDITIPQDVEIIFKPNIQAFPEKESIQMPKNDMVKDPKGQGREYMDLAIRYLNKSYNRDPKDVNTVYKLSICYWNIEDCRNAWKYYDEAVALGGRPITEEYTKDLKSRCERN